MFELKGPAARLCPKCLLFLGGADLIVYNEVKYHADCAVCSKCTKKLTSEDFREKGKQFYCKKCYEKRFGDEERDDFNDEDGMVAKVEETKHQEQEHQDSEPLATPHTQHEQLQSQPQPRRKSQNESPTPELQQQQHQEPDPTEDHDPEEDSSSTSVLSPGVGEQRVSRAKLLKRKSSQRLKAVKQRLVKGVSGATGSGGSSRASDDSDGKSDA